MQIRGRRFRSPHEAVFCPRGLPPAVAVRPYNAAPGGKIKDARGGEPTGAGGKAAAYGGTVKTTSKLVVCTDPKRVNYQPTR